MTMADIKREDLFRLIKFMDKTDSAIYSAYIGNGYNDWEIVFSPKGFARVKTAIVVWGRIAEILGFKNFVCVNNMPKITIDEDMDDVSEMREVISEYSMSSYDLSYVEDTTYAEAGIEVFHDVMDADTYENIVDMTQEEAVENGEELDADEIDKMAWERYGAYCCPELNADFPSFYREMFDFSVNNNFIANFTYIKSRRIGRFVQNKSQLKDKLPKDLYEGIEFLINRVCFPTYRYLNEMTLRGALNKKGEYCAVFTTGSFMEYDEEIVDLHKCPYAEFAVVLLGGLLTEAEALAPELLSDTKATDMLVVDATVAKPACAA